MTHPFSKDNVGEIGQKRRKVGGIGRRQVCSSEAALSGGVDDDQQVYEQGDERGRR